MQSIIKICKLCSYPEGYELKYATDGSSGVDLYVGSPEHYFLKPLERKLFTTGLIIQIPQGMEGQVRSRSGLALNHGIQVFNSPGTIDSDYRGEIGVILINLSDKDFLITKGMKIAQLVFARYQKVLFEEVTTFDATERGEGGFGSTGY